MASAQTVVVDDAALRKAGTAGGEWLTYGLTLAETRYSSLKQIDTGNVGRLGQAWAYDLGSTGGGQLATPLVWNGTLYGITNWSVVFAIDARTGKERWRWDPEVNQTAVRPKICCGVVNRGIALYKNMVIAPVIDGRLQALDAETGKVLWETRVAYPQDDYTITMAPRIAKGKIIIGASGGEYPVRGFFDAYDAETGRRLWRFYTVPGDPSKPFENPALKTAAATWEGEWWKLGGGATVWDGMAYDPVADLIYVGTGNAGPWPQMLRFSKGKDNLYVCSILAVRPDTGELAWYFQTVPGDSWDHDSTSQLTLADLTINGKPRKVIMQAAKNGFFYVIDRISGAFISGAPFARVTWARGLDPVTGRPIVNDEADYGTEPVDLYPGPVGAHASSAMSFNPATGLVYFAATIDGKSSYAVDTNFTHKPGRQNTGLIRGATATRPTPAAVGPPVIDGQRNVLFAWDPVTQTERWRAQVGGSRFGGTVTTAGNLVFQVVPDGRLIAYNAQTGEKLLEIQTEFKVGMGPPITYQLDGKQYVAFLGGMGQPPTPPAVGGTPAANPAESTPSPSPKLLTFVVGGSASQPAAKPSGSSGGAEDPHR
ncbi:MAG: PQQ-dependent dehydrogenase, methanol/ethanol family [Candidatus Korobacteraceae bacterium]